MAHADHKSLHRGKLLKDNDYDEHQKESTLVYDITDTCFDILERLVSAVDGNSASENPSTLPDSIPSDDPVNNLKGIRNSFAFWIDYTGALAPVGASLDDRLQDHDEIKEMVTELLEMVERNLRILEREMEESVGFPTTKSQHWMSATSSALDRLHFLASAIRKASVKKQEQNLFSFTSDEDRLFHSMAVSYIKWKFPNARLSLREHIANSIASRRQALLQKHKHAKKLKARRAPKLPPATRPKQSVASVQSVAAKPAAAEGVPRVLASVTGSKATRASKMDGEAALQRIYQKPTLSLRSSGSLQQRGSVSVEYPEPPKFRAGEKHAPCPYCLEPLPAVEMRKATARDYWRRHINQDLKPYVCLFRNCTNAYFAHLSDWSNHMAMIHSENWPRKVHSTTWYCDLDHEHEQEVMFDNEADWRKHMLEVSNHPSRSKPPSETQLKALAVQKQQVAPRDPHVCPFCEEMPQQIDKLRDRGNSEDVAKILLYHIAEHVLSLSFLSLPALEDGAIEDNRRSTNFESSSRTRQLHSGSTPRLPSGVKDVEDISLTFDRGDSNDSRSLVRENPTPVLGHNIEDPEGDHSSASKISVEKHVGSDTETELAQFFTTIPETDFDFSWDFVPQRDVPLGPIDSAFERWHTRVDGDRSIQFNDDQKAALDSLYFPEIYSRRDDIAKPADSTCGWLLQHPTYLKWIAQPCGVLWLTGGLGAGKSTLMKYSLVETEPELEKSSHKLIVASFFFHTEGSVLQRDFFGLLRSILYQILHEVPELLDSFSSMYRIRCQNLGQVGESWDWREEDIHDLQGFFNYEVAKMAKTHRVRIFIDALDESDEFFQARLVEFLQHVVSSTKALGGDLSVLFSSRQFLRLERDENHIGEIHVDEENRRDLETYLRNNTDLPVRVQEKIVAESEGSFLRVILAAQNPSDYYSSLLQQISEEDRPQVLKLFQWICFAIRPLLLAEIRIAMVIDVDTSVGSITECKMDIEGDSADADTEMSRRVQNLSKGLAEVKEHENKQVVRLVHPSVHEYLVDEGLRILDEPHISTIPPGSVAGRAHFRLSRSCLRYLGMEEFREPGLLDTAEKVSEPNSDSRIGYSLLSYAVTFWIRHVVEVEQESLHQEDLQSFFQPPSKLMRVWLQLYPKFSPDSTEVPRPGTTLLHLISKNNILSALESVLDGEGIDAGLKDDRGRTPLSMAAENGHARIIRYLVERKDVEADLKDYFGQTPLSYAAKNGHEAIVRLLVEREDVKANSKDEYHRTPLSFAARYGHEAIVRLLIEREDVETDLKDFSSQTPLSLAAENGHEAIVQLLIEREGVEADSKDKYNNTPLSLAATYGHEAIVRLLVERKDVEADPKDRFGQTPLSLAAGNGHEAIVRLLVEREDVEADSKDEHGQTPLSFAAEKGRSAVVQLLVARDDVDADSKNNRGETPLSLAAEGGHNEVVVLLASRNDVDVNSKDKSGNTPLSLATRDGHDEIRIFLRSLGARE